LEPNSVSTSFQTSNETCIEIIGTLQSNLWFFVRGKRRATSDERRATSRELQSIQNRGLSARRKTRFDWNVDIDSKKF
jgi:hypothetical protein